jgi:hypothetical protein
VNCVTNHQPGAPIYFASDSEIGISAIQKYSEAINRTMITASWGQLLHLELAGRQDQIRDATPPPPSAYYSTFVDLFITGNAK